MFLISFIGDNNKTIRELAAIMNILMMRDLRCIILIDPWNFQESPFQKSREGRPNGGSLIAFGTHVTNFNFKKKMNKLKLEMN